MAALSPALAVPVLERTPDVRETRAFVDAKADLGAVNRSVHEKNEKRLTHRGALRTYSAARTVGREKNVFRMPLGVLRDKIPEQLLNNIPRVDGHMTLTASEFAIGFVRPAVTSIEQ